MKVILVWIGDHEMALPCSITQVEIMQCMCLRKMLQCYQVSIPAFETNQILSADLISSVLSLKSVCLYLGTPVLTSAFILRLSPYYNHSFWLRVRCTNHAKCNIHSFKCWAIVSLSVWYEEKSPLLIVGWQMELIVTENVIFALRSIMAKICCHPSWVQLGIQAWSMVIGWND